MKVLILIIIDSTDTTIIIMEFMINFMPMNSTDWNCFGKKCLERNKVPKRLKEKLKKKKSK